MFNSLRVRLTLLFLGLTIIPLVIVGALVSSRGTDTLQQQSVNLQHQLARQTAISLGAFFNERQNELRVLTQVYGFDTLDPEDQKNVLLTMLSHEPAYYQFSLVNAAGQELIRVTRGEIVTSNDLGTFGAEPQFQRTVDTNTITFSNVYFDEMARDRMITIDIPIEDLYTGEVGYVLVADVRFQNIEEEILRGLNLTEGEDVYIVDSNDVVIAHRNPSYVLNETVFGLPDSEGRHTGLAGGDVILAMDTLQLEDLKLTIVAETAYGNATRLASDLSRLAANITIATLVIAGAIVVWNVRRVVKPIVQMSHVAEAIQAGDLSAQANESGNDEIALLGRTFNKMTGQLEQTLKGLQDNVEQLENARVEREKLIEDLLAAKRIAEENSRLKSEFLSTMSHELRTPLNAIEGFTSIMLSGMGIDLSPRAEDMIRRVSANSKRLLQLINDFLDLSRIEAGRLELVKDRVSPESLAEKWRREIGVLAEEKGIEFVVTVDPDLPSELLADEDALSKVAANLLSNAFKFTHKGRVTLDLEQVNEASWAISVSDTGIGIPPHAREYIFDEFRQVDSSSKRLYGGTGLGLSLVQKLTRAMGGTVSLRSEVGKGSTFTVTLPLDTVEEPEGAIA